MKRVRYLLAWLVASAHYIHCFGIFLDITDLDLCINICSGRTMIIYKSLILFYLLGFHNYADYFFNLGTLKYGF